MKLLSGMARIIVAAATLSIGQHAYAAEQPLGRLFYTPQERSNMDHRPVAREDTATATQMVINGRIRRSDGKTTAWINGEITPEATTDTHRVPSAPHRTHALKVGESIDLGSGTVSSPLEGGSLVIRRTPSR